MTEELTVGAEASTWARGKLGAEQGVEEDLRRPELQDEVGEDAKRLPSSRAWACRFTGPWRSS